MSLVNYISFILSSVREIVYTAVALVLVASLVIVFCNLYLHPLRHVPGPLLGRVTSLFIYTICYLGIEGRVSRHYHRKYKTKVLRVAPNHISISESAAVNDIYIKAAGFQKDDRYKNFNLGPFVSIFSAIDIEYRNLRAKAVAPLFAPARLRQASDSNGVIQACVAEFVLQLQALKDAALVRPPGAVKADILDLSARLSIDVVTGYLLGEQYGGLQEQVPLSMEARQRSKLSANPFIFAIVAFSRFSLLPNWLFRRVYATTMRLNRDEKLLKAFARLDDFANQVVKTAIIDPERAMNTYQGRLLDAGISTTEATVQSKAIIFAGADSTAVMLSSIMFHLVQNADVRIRILHEVRSQGGIGATVDLQALSYLRAVVKEGLRLGMANPMRFTRVVPPAGFCVGGFNLPFGTIVGCAPYIIHHDPEVFPDPFTFRPERWLEEGKDEGLGRRDMERSMMPFGVGLRACIGKNLAQQQIYETVVAVVESGVLDWARTCQKEIEMVEWFNGEIKGHKLEVEWYSGS